VGPFLIYLSNDSGERRTALLCNALQRIPESILKTHAGVMIVYNYRTLTNCGSHNSRAYSGGRVGTDGGTFAGGGGVR
jgi:hypothetical protein